MLGLWLISAASAGPRGVDRTVSAPSGTATQDPGPDTRADIVLGQPDMVTPFPNRTDARGLLAPADVAIDRSTTPCRLFVADTANHRVLGYASASIKGSAPPADRVIGQPSLSCAYLNEIESGPHRLHTPVSLAVDRAGNLYVSDPGYHRVVVFVSPFETDTAADAVYGQHGDMFANSPNAGGRSAETLCHPQGISLDEATRTLWIADAGNHRVLACPMVDVSPTGQADAGRLAARRVLGWSDMTSVRPDGMGPGPSVFSGPADVTVSAGWLFVADTGHHRVLGFGRPVASGASARAVWGQDGHFDRAEPGCSPFRVHSPRELTFTGDRGVASPRSVAAGNKGGHLLVSDAGNHRVLRYAADPQGSRQPDAVWGQGRGLKTGTPSRGGVTAASLNHPAGHAMAPDGTMWLADRGHHRVLGFTKGMGGDPIADRVLGQVDLDHASPNLTDGTGLAFPRDVAVDRSVKPARLYVCDFENHRILGYASVRDLSPDTRPTIVIGQPDVHGWGPGGGRMGLNFPAALAVDADGGLYVADRENNRVLWFDRPFETDLIADRVWGQPDFVGVKANHGGVTAASLHRPEGLAVDRAGRLYVADTRNHRVLRFDEPGDGDQRAAMVWGQGGDFTKAERNAGGGPGPRTLAYPFGLAVTAAGRLAVADTENHRVVLFDVNGDDPLRAIRVLGQAGDMAGRRDNRGGCSARSLSGPEGVCFAHGGLFVADTANCRVLFFHEVGDGQNGPGDDVADRVYGQQGRFDQRMRPRGVISGQTLWYPSGLDTDDGGHLYVADREPCRVLVFRSP